MRLDAELLARTPSYLNPLNDREIDLRGHKIPAIENLGVTRDLIDCYDFTDNNITSISNFPFLKRLSTLLLSNNPIRSISTSITTSLPNLKILILSNNSFTAEYLPSLAATLSKLKKLNTLVLKPSIITNHEHYKDYLIFNCKKLTSLDYQRISNQDRTTATALFETPQGTPTPLALSLTSVATTTTSATTDNTFQPGSAVEPTTGATKITRVLTKEEKDRVRKAIEGASSVEEIRRLTRMLGQGFLPTEKDLKDLEKKKAV